MTAIFAERLKNARKMLGLSMDELCVKMGNVVSKQSISKYESGKMIPDSSVLLSLSRALEMPVDYFFRPFTFNVENVQFRKKSRLSAKESASIKERIVDLLERYIGIETVCAFDASFSQQPFQDIADASAVVSSASRLRDAWKLGEDGIQNVIEMLEEHGIKVLEIDADLSFDGLCTIVNGRYPVVVVNSRFPSERKRFTALHELGHLVLEFRSDMSAKERESFCHLFANEMLISADAFRRLLGSSRHDISYQELRAIQSQFGISVDALMYKAKSLGIISETRYITFCRMKNADPAMKQKIEQSLYPAESSTRFVRLVYRALSSELISSSKAASLLGISIDRVREELALV